MAAAITVKAVGHASAGFTPMIGRSTRELPSPCGTYGVVVDVVTVASARIAGRAALSCGSSGTDPERQGHGIGRRTMEELQVEIAARWPVAMLSTAGTAG